jgi:aryl-alcohol dehydrogenase-like predicted oxidoreductase
MQRKLPQTDLRVSRLCFGTMTFGKPVDQATASRMVDCSVAAGINFFDTANVYQLGASETMLGEAIRGKRDQLVVASKVRGKMGEGAEQCGLSKKAIFSQVEQSLRRLQTDYLDIYYLHQPDYGVAIEETLEAMNSLLLQGKIRYVGSSNYASWQVGQMLCLAENRGLAAPVIAQPMYNLLARGIEQEFVPMAKQFAVSLVAYNPLAGGLLTGKHALASVTPNTRFDDNQMYQDRYWHPQDFEAVRQLQKVADVAGRTLVSLALNWLLHHSAADCVILGASRLEQLEQNLAASDQGPLPPETVAACDEVWQRLRGPTPVYNR